MLKLIDHQYEEAELPSSVNTYANDAIKPYPIFVNPLPLSLETSGGSRILSELQSLSQSSSTNGLFEVISVVSGNLITGFSSKYIQALHRPGLLDHTLEKLADLPRLARQSTLVANDIAPDALKLAEKFIVRMYYAVVKNSCVWKIPHISFDDNEGITFEWWHNKRVLTIFVTPSTTIEYQRAWGPNIWEEMDDGEDPSDKQLEALWQWICAPSKK